MPPAPWSPPPHRMRTRATWSPCSAVPSRYPRARTSRCRRAIGAWMAHLPGSRQQRCGAPSGMLRWLSCTVIPPRLEHPARSPAARLRCSPPPPAGGGEWYPTAAPPSPLSPSLAGLPWDSLPPLELPPTTPHGDWQGLLASRAHTSERRPVFVGIERPRRAVVITASGLWRWQFRGGPSADAFTTLWGSIFDWLSTERADRRAALPVDPVIRAGERIRWRPVCSRRRPLRIFWMACWRAAGRRGRRWGSISIRLRTRCC